MNGIQIFENQKFGTIRTMEERGDILFCGSDVANALGFTNPRKALLDHCRGVTKRYTLTSGGPQHLSYIKEPDLYRLVFSSKLPRAEEFADWVTTDVLPSIRKTGAYSTEDGASACTAEVYLEAARIMASCLDSNRQYVMNILKNIAPNIYEVPLAPAAISPAPPMAPVQQNNAPTVTHTKSREGYAVPFRNDLLAALLAKRGVTQSMVASVTGTCKDTVHNWMIGKHRPSRDHRNRLCAFFSVTVGYFDGLAKK